MSEFEINIAQIELVATLCHEDRMKTIKMKHQTSPKKMNRIKYSCEKPRRIRSVFSKFYEEQREVCQEEEKP